MLFVLSIFGGTTSYAEICPDAEVFGLKLFDNICWNCIFPMRIAGTTLDFSGSGPVNESPDDSPNSVLCSCADNNGVVMPGMVAGWWEPAKLVELVRAPFCSMALGGERIQDTYRGFGYNQPNDRGGNSSFYQMHYYSFPVMAMLDMFVDADCNSDGFMDMDLAYMSEYDPTWINDELALIVNFETMIYANPVAIAACIADAGAASVHKPLNILHWCAGTWGKLYPLTGNSNTSSSTPEATSLAAARTLALMHRRGLNKKTSGSGALCRAQLFPSLPKQQYKIGMFHPLPETKTNHWIGQSPFTWGEWRNIPAVGEDHLYTIYRWTDCCMRYQ